MRVKKHHLFKIWAEICLVFFVLQSTVIAECDSLYVEIEQNCYWQQDIQFLNDLIANSDLTIEPLELGDQNWTNGRLTSFSSANSDLKGEMGAILNDDLTIACGSGSIKILEIQRQGKKVQKSKEFLLGSRMKKGSILS